MRYLWIWIIKQLLNVLKLARVTFSPKCVHRPDPVLSVRARELRAYDVGEYGLGIIASIMRYKGQRRIAKAMPTNPNA